MSFNLIATTEQMFQMWCQYLLPKHWKWNNNIKKKNKNYVTSEGVKKKGFLGVSAIVVSKFTGKKAKELVYSGRMKSDILTMVGFHQQITQAAVNK